MDLYIQESVACPKTRHEDCTDGQTDGRTDRRNTVASCMQQTSDERTV